jgi:hypothetical protein
MTKAGLRRRRHPHLLTTTTTHLAPKDERDHDQIQYTTKTLNWVFDQHKDVGFSMVNYDLIDYRLALFSGVM